MKLLGQLEPNIARMIFTPVSPTYKTDCHNITEILLKVALNTIFKFEMMTLYRLYFLLI
jgi:hypothetical protein